MPLAVILSAFGFNVINAYLQAGWIFSLSPPHRYGTAWLMDLRFWFGLLLFLSGMAINRSADNYLRRLMLRRESGYALPQGGLFRFVSCPNYLGEIVQWSGWAVAVWSIPGFAFAFWTLANLLPRARAHHMWYKAHFPEYPLKRKAIIPFLF